jgi:hypothetical protein
LHWPEYQLKAAEWVTDGDKIKVDADSHKFTFEKM